MSTCLNIADFYVDAMSNTPEVTANIYEGFTRVYNQVDGKTHHRKLIEGDKYVVVSDLHLGDGDVKTDKSTRCSDTLRAMLQRYYDEGYTLIMLGDIEETYQYAIEDVVKGNEDIYHLLNDYNVNGKLIKVWGNHDFLWMDEGNTEKYLGHLVPNLVHYEGVVLELPSGRDIFLLHGHQGSLQRDSFEDVAGSWVTKNVIHPMTKFCCCLPEYQTPSTSYTLRTVREKNYYKWANDNDLATVVGHTHAPTIGDSDSIKNNDKYFNTGHCFTDTGECYCIEIDILGVSLHVHNGDAEEEIKKVLFSDIYRLENVVEAEKDVEVVEAEKDGVQMAYR